LIDLGAWAEERYKIPGQEIGFNLGDDDDEDDEDKQAN
jgi:endogenous inhibitor of DNA gyrase (YacG/DUF329 family)